MNNDKILTKDEQKTNLETKSHIHNVQKFIKLFTDELEKRGINHDMTKLEYPELPLFTIHTKNLSASTYGSDEYKGFLEQLKPALDHHYAKNRHHPEHYPNGVNGMTLIDIIELFCDWKSATLRHNDGNLLKSIEINAKRFNMSEQLKEIFINTTEIFDHKKV